MPNRGEITTDLNTTAGSLLDRTLEAAVKDRQTVTSAGQDLGTLIDGVRFRDLPTHIDERGSVTEMFDPRWNWHPDPFVFAYCFTILPGFVKGWNLTNSTRIATAFCRARWKSSCTTYGRRHPPTAGSGGSY